MSNFDEMKNYIVIMAAFCLVMTASCSGKFEVGHEVNSGLYILKSGKQEITVSSQSASYDLHVCKSGLNDDVFAVSLAVDIEDLVVWNAKYMSAWRILPPNSYEIAEKNFLVGKDDVKTSVRINFFYDRLPEGTHMLPIRLRCTSDASVPVRQEYSVTYLFVTKGDMEEGNQL